jgi:hypothetical protein
MDGGDMEMAEEMRSLFEETNPEFRYFADVKEDIEELKKQVAQNTQDIKVLNKSGGRVVNAASPRELVINYANPLSTVDDHKKIITDLLKFDLDEISEGYFNEIYNIDVPYVRGFGWGDVKNWHNALNFLETILSDERIESNQSKEEGVNPETVAYYVFFHIYSYASYMSDCDDEMIKYNDDYNMDGCTNQAIGILDRLYTYMQNNDLSFTFDKSLFNSYSKEAYIFCPSEMEITFCFVQCVFANNQSCNS